MIEKITKRLWTLAVLLTLCFGMTILPSCSKDDDKESEQNKVSEIADKVWTFSQAHPDGFTLDIRTMTEPKEGIAVSYAATQNSHSREQLDKVVSHSDGTTDSTPFSFCQPARRLS